MLEPIPFAGMMEIDEINNKPVAWMYAVNGIWTAFSDELPPDDAYDEGTLIPLYTHSAINNGGNLEELNTKVQDASTSLESTPPINTEPVGRYYWESVVDGHFMAVPSEGTIHYEIDDFPLYLHPAKEYKEPSVKEINDLWLSVINNIPANDHRPREWHFAKAILRKAQEK